MSFKILLLTVDPQNLDQIPEEWKSELEIDLEPIEGKEYDACFVYEKVEKTTSFLVRKNSTVFIPGEPQTIKGFGTPFLSQFDHLMSFRNDLRHDSYLQGQIPCLTPWRVGLDESLEREGKPRHIRTPEEMKKPIQKTKFMSMIVSNKPGTPLQRARLKLAKTLIEQYPGLVDVYGRGINEIRDKAEALDPYMFSIAVENSYLPNYMTEKLTDCFVSATVPLYSGCPNIGCFYGSGVVVIDPWDILGTIKTIRKIANDPMSFYKDICNGVIGQRNNLIYKHSIIARIYDFVRTYYPYPIEKRILEPDEVGYYW